MTERSGPAHPVEPQPSGAPADVPPAGDAAGPEPAGEAAPAETDAAKQAR